MTAPAPPEPRRTKSLGGRPRGDPEALRTATIGVRVSVAEYAALRERSAAMGMTPAQWLREAALKRRLPPPPATLNRQHYIELGRLAANLNQLAKRANEGGHVVLADALLQRLQHEVSCLRVELLGEVAADIVGEYRS